jgi:hypothetical protein
VYALTTHLFSRRRGSIRAVYAFRDQATRLFPFSRAPRMCFSMDQTTVDFPRAWDVRRSDQKQSRTAGRKRVIAATTDHLAVLATWHIRSHNCHPIFAFSSPPFAWRVKLRKGKARMFFSLFLRKSLERTRKAGTCLENRLRKDMQRWRVSFHRYFRT